MEEGDQLKSLPKLPRGKSVIDVFADFFRYLHDCARRHITETHANGDALWASVKDDIDYVLSHPNGWEGQQQEQMRLAATTARLIPDNALELQRIRFITEGEASLQFCAHSGLTRDVVQV
jgi:hypothetical protein